MLNLTMGLHRSCDRVTRRDLLRVGSLAALGLIASGLLAAAGQAGSQQARTFRAS